MKEKKGWRIKKHTQRSTRPTQTRHLETSFRITGSRKEIATWRFLESENVGDGRNVWDYSV